MKNPKKILSILVVSLLISSLLFTGCKKEKEQQPTAEKQIEVPLQINLDAQLSEDQSENLQTSLILLSDLYLKAAVTTNIALSTTPENSTYDEWVKNTEESMKAWENLGKKLKYLEEITNSLETAKEANKTWGYSNVFNSASAAAPDPALVTAVFDSTPANKKSLQNLMDYFGWDAKTALKQLKIAQGQIEANAWNEEGDAHEMLQNQAKIISDTMKVSLLIGGMAVTAGATTPTIAGTAGSIFMKGSLILEGTDLAMALSEDAMIVIGNEDGEAIIKQKRDKISVPCKILSIVKLKDVKDPGNLITITELGIEYGTKFLDWEKTMRADMGETSVNLKFRKSDLTGDLPAFDPEDIERFRLEAKKAWEELGIPEVIKEAEENMREQKKAVDEEIEEYLKQKAQIEHDLEILKSMQGGDFTTVDPAAIDKLSRQLEEINKKIKQKQALSDSLDIGDENKEAKKYPETLTAKGTWKNSHGDSGEINMSFPSAGGSFSGGFSGCPNGICWSSTVSGTFDGNDPGTITGTVSGSIAATQYTPKFTISGSFKGEISLTNETVSGTFSNSMSDTTGQYGTYTDSGTWSATFDNGLD